jgi:hypothetical protein
MALCTVAVLAAGCANHDNQTNAPLTGVNNATAPSVAQCTNTVGDRVWFDVNCNGIQDKDENGGPEGIKVTLTNCDTGAARGTATDTNGFYSFTDVPSGFYRICIEIPGGFAATEEDANGDSNDGIDSDINSEGCTGCRFYDCGSDDLSRDAGLCEKKGEEGTEGCTPGFWRNHLTHWAAAGISPTATVNATFGCHLVASDATTLATAIDAPQTYGVLVFHAIAALLNSSHPGVDFGLDAGEVIDLACAGDKNTLATENEKGCPLSGGNTTGNGGGKKK